MMAYRVKLEPDDGTLLVTCPVLPEVTTFGENVSKAEEAALGAIEEAIAARISYGDPLPRGDAKAGRNEVLVRLPILTSLKALLYITLRESGLTRAELARRLGWQRERVDRLFRLDHASKLDNLEAAFLALQRELDVEVRKKKAAR
jgi:antitoxin HicB